MKNVIRILLCIILISGCALTIDEDESIDRYYKNCLNHQTLRETHIRFLGDEKDFQIFCKGVAKRSAEIYREELFNRLRHQPSYDPNYEIRRLRDDLTTQSIIQNGKIKEMGKEVQRLETQRLQRESMERVQEQRRQIEQGILEDNRKREMHKLRQDLLYRGIY